MFLSVLDVFKVGIGPSSSHTVGPMIAALRFLEELKKDKMITDVGRIRASLHGSLAFTGKGHGSDRAVVLGLLGETPKNHDPEVADKLIKKVSKNKSKRQ